MRRLLRSAAGRGDVGSADLSVLATRAGRGDRVARDAFVEQTLPDVSRYCSNLLDADRADDATQATYVRALQSIHRFRGESSARTWIIGVARHVCLDELRSSHRRSKLLDRLARQPTAGDTAIAEGELDLHRAIAGLAPDRREAFVLTQLLGFTYDETAAIVGCPPGTVRSRVARGRTDLLSMLDDRGEDIEVAAGP